MYFYKKTYFILIVFFLATRGSSQSLIPIALLEETISESSGLIFLNNRLITHNDSGNAPELYEINPSNGLISRSIEVTNTTNIDWEDMTYDDAYIYIGDFGNNNGDRQNLSIHRISISEYLSVSSTIISDETIRFNYKEQTDFTPSPFATNFDAEALVSIGNHLYLFTKNWVNFKTDIYQIPKIAGTYEIQKIASLDVEGLITGATYNSSKNNITLTGYNTSGAAFLVELINFNSSDFSYESLHRNMVAIPNTNSPQIEAIICKDDDSYYITSEAFQDTPATLFEFNTNTLHLSLNSMRRATSTIFPNPTSDSVKIENADYVKSRVFDIKGVYIKETSTPEISFNNLPQGVYLVQLFFAKGNKEYIKVIKK